MSQNSDDVTSHVTFLNIKKSICVLHVKPPRRHIAIPTNSTESIENHLILRRKHFLTSHRFHSCKFVQHKCHKHVNGYLFKVGLLKS